MAETSIKTKVLKLSQEQYETLVAEGQITVEGVTYEYSPEDTIYVTPDSIGDKSYKIVESLPVSNIDLDTYYLTKKTRPTYNYGGYCTNKVPYPTNNIPSWSLSQGNITSFLVYNSLDGCYYLFNQYAGGGGNAKYFAYHNGYFVAIMRGGYNYGKFYKYDPVNSTEWVEIPINIYAYRNENLFPISTAHPFKFLWCSGTENVKIVDYNDSSYEVLYEVKNTAVTDPTTEIYANFFDTTGEYLGDLDNADESQIFTYNMNLYNGSTFDIVGEFDIQEFADYFIDYVDNKITVEINNELAEIIGEVS